MEYIGICLCILFSAFFSASELAFSSVSKIKLEKKAEKGIKRATEALYLVNHFDECLSTILIGNNLVNITASAIFTIIMLQSFGNKGTLLATIMMTVIILIFGEITPKVLAKNRSEKFVMFAAPILYKVNLLLRPISKIIIKLTNRISGNLFQEEAVYSEEFLETMIDEGEEQGIFDEEASELLYSALDFPDTNVSEILTPRLKMECIDIDSPMDEMIEQILDTSYSRLPVYQDSIDNILGIVYVRQILSILSEGKEFSKEDFRKSLLDISYIHETMRLPEAFHEMNRRGVHLAIVNDEFGGVIGCVSLEDMLEELVGEIWDESDMVEEMIRLMDKRKYEVLCDISFRDFTDYFDLNYDLMESGQNTFGGWLQNWIGYLPDEEDIFIIENMKITIIEKDPRRVKRVNVEILKKNEN